MEIKIIEIIQEVPCLAIWSRTIGLNELLLPNLVPGASMAAGASAAAAAAGRAAGCY
jgi:hypothetical protein